jgi:SNF2 family DNA or RNA helicase
MHILHGTWIPAESDQFIQEGNFCLWVETTIAKRRRTPTRLHPRQLEKSALGEFLRGLGIKPSSSTLKLDRAIIPQFFCLPTADDKPLPSLELARYLEEELPEEFSWQYWQVDCFVAALDGDMFTNKTNLIRLLNDLHFAALHNLADVQLGADLLFWYHYTQHFKQVILRDQYIPALRYRSLPQTLQPSSSKAATKSTAQSARKTTPKTATQTLTQTSAHTATRKSTRTQRSKPAQEPTVSPGADCEIYPSWEIISNAYEQAFDRFIEQMPLVCGSGHAIALDTPQLYDRETLLRHFSECCLHQLVVGLPSSAALTKKIANTLLYSCLYPGKPWSGSSHLAQYQQWQTWRDRIAQSQTNLPFYLCFRLHAPEKQTDRWFLEFQVASREDPSTRISLLDFWQLTPAQQKKLRKKLSDQFEQHLLMHLGYAARIYPKLWSGLETDEPIGIQLTVDEAFDFLKELAWVLEESGYKVIIPSWWTPQGWQRAKIRLRASGRKPTTNNKNKSYLSLYTLVDYQYELSIDGEPVSEREWQKLVNSKSALVQFRGEWIELDRDKMQQMLEFWQTHKQEHPELSLLDFMKLTASADEFEVVHDQTLAAMLHKLNDTSQLEELPDLKQFQGELRGYQKRGVAWLHYLESIGFHGCLADDMGLGKSAQVIARLVHEREFAAKQGRKRITPPPTLLIAPTSVVGNWEKEIEKFAPHLRSLIHHGSSRIQDTQQFMEQVSHCDVVITSFTIARKDQELLHTVQWQRLVVDEAQNIKNPKAAQTKAILKLPANHRLALTGTPIENRLLDLWSIFNFLNPGYLGKETQFRQSFEVPIQKNNDTARSTTLKKLVEPFILRRVKTDPTIIQDLPDKVEQKLFCNLTKEQASLYEALVRDVERQLQEVEGIQRKGLILSTLLKLKQICNHPRQFLQDGSDFTPERSHKLDRLVEMVNEVIAENESLLIFTQFTEMGEAIEKYIKSTLHYNTYYLHGGTSRPKREQMIAEFQDPDTEPSVFILSLKAGGVGITLTKANHVFHFDRWWNPAVEDQATDRAFRIGQTKNVFVHKFVAIGTLEERIDQMIQDKKKLAGSIVGSDESWLTELDNAAFKKLIALNRNAILE